MGYSNKYDLVELQQMKVNTRLAVLEFAKKLMCHPHYSGAADTSTLTAMAGEIEKYVLGNTEEQSEDALAQARAKESARPVMRP